MNCPTNQPVNNPAPRSSTATDYGTFIVASLFIFLGIASLLQHDWWDASGQLLFALGLLLMLVPPAFSQQNWKRPRDLACVLLLVIGIGLSLTAPSHHPKQPGTAAANGSPSQETSR